MTSIQANISQTCKHLNIAKAFLKYCPRAPAMHGSTCANANANVTGMIYRLSKGPVLLENWKVQWES